MKIDQITFSNFRCFQELPTTIHFEPDITCLVGNNGSGKTTSILALKRLFGTTLEDRTIIRDDFYLAANESYKDVYGRKLHIDIIFSFPELNGDITGARETCPAFSSVIYADKNGILKARMRLEATWDETEYEDDVQSKIYWITTSEIVEFGENKKFKFPVSPHDRKQIKLRYIPAFRDSKATLKNEVKSLTKLLEEYTDTGTAKENIEGLSEKLSSEIQNLESIKTTTVLIKNIWRDVHDNTLKHYQNPKLEATPTEIGELLRSISVKLGSSENGGSRDINELSDGQISLLYFTLSIALYEIEQAHYAGKVKGFKELDKDIAIFTIFAFEEPENHLSPHYLGRVLNLLHAKTNTIKATGIITSHSSSVIRRMKRVEQIRHFQQTTNLNARYSIVNKILLPPNKSDEDYKYINQAVLAHPELYFSKLVVLGEGDSEEIVIPQLAKKMGFDLDPSFVAFVKLGGRHINHMWRLLNNLKIPYITLLDLDLGRFGGGPPRIKNIITHFEEDDIYITLPDGLKDDDLKGISINNLLLESLLNKLEEHNVFFSIPLDLDMSMIQAFPECYKADKARKSERKVLEKAVLGKKKQPKAYIKSGFSLSNEELKKYRYLFGSKSKVASHYNGIANVLELDLIDIKSEIPNSINNLIQKCSSLLENGIDDE